MSKLDKLAPAGYYYTETNTHKDGHKTEPDSVVYISHTGMCSYARVGNNNGEWFRLYWCAAPRKSWATPKKDYDWIITYDQFETYEAALASLDPTVVAKLTKSDCPDNLR
tara:strand:- start:1441 stop:1770 length:330 start_codon:yes stop_codon:yes gene_type:complete